MAESEKPETEAEPKDGHAEPARSAEAPPETAESERESDGDGEAEDLDDASPPGPPWLPAAIAFALPALLFLVLPPLTKAGLWDPHELNVADLARRIALNLHGAADLALEGADNSLPHLNDLGRPQLPFTSIALGFKAFGLHEWAGRVPLAIWGILGVLATYGFVARLIDRRAGVFSAVALATMPLYFVEARTMLGDIVTMAAFAMAFGGLAACVFGARDDEPEASGMRARIGWLLVGITGLAAGYFSRGAILSVAAPMLGVGLAFAVVIGNGGRRFDALANAVGSLAAVGGLTAAALGVWALATDKSHDLNPLIGSMVRPPGKYPTFEFEIGHIAAGLAPWAAFVPFAAGRMLIPPPVRSGSAFARESEARLALLLGGGVAFVAHGWVAARTDLIGFAAPAVFAATCGVALRDYERGAFPSIAVGVGTLVLLGLSHHEMHRMPEKAFNAFAVTGATFPDSFKDRSLLIWTAVLVGFAGVAFLTMIERTPFKKAAALVARERTPFDPKNYLRVLIALRDAWDGMLALAYFAMVAGASLAGLVLWIGTRQHARWMPQLGAMMRDVVMNAWWVTAFVPLFVIFGIYFWCDVWLWAFGRARPFGTGSASRGFEPFEELASFLANGKLGERLPRLVMGKIVVTEDDLEEGLSPMALFALGPLMYLQVPGIVFLGLWQGMGLRPLVSAALAIPSGVALFLGLGLIGDLLRGSRAAFLATFAATVGAVLCLWYYPALANQLSPKEVFESYQHIKKDNEPLALFGVGGRTAAYYAGGQPLILKDANQAYDWLASGDGASRRFLAVRAEELPRLNRAYRERSGKSENIPVIDARSSQIILVASRLEQGEKNENPLSRIVLETPPKPQRKVEANLEDKLLVLGYDIVDANGKLADHVVPGKKYHMKTYFKVLAPIQSEWEMFIHIDGFHRRHNGDHKMCEGKYPMSLWLKDDIVMDDYEFTLEPNFSPGPYTNYFGLFVGDSRLKIKSGPADSENRVNGGTIRVQ